MNTRVLIFKERDFPFADTTPIENQWILEALPPVQEVRSVGVSDMRERLRADSVNLFINPYGSAFPKEAWPAIYGYLAAGGNMINIGGAPFSVPVCRDADGWHQEIPQTQYHRKLGVNRVYEVETRAISRYDTTDTAPLLSGLTEGFSCERAFELQMSHTSTADPLDGLRSWAGREVVLRPLLYACDSDGRRISAPILALDHIRDEFMGGRWVFMNYHSECPPRKEAFRRLAAYATLGACDIQIKPSFACYQPDERASLVLRANRFRDCGENVFLTVTIRKENSVRTEEIEIVDFASPYYLTIPVPQPLTAGLYTVEARLSQDDLELTDKFADCASSGFRCYDKALVGMTQSLSAGQDYFTRDGKPVPLIGTTYTASDAQSNLLLEPNPSAWYRDLADMREIGINVVRIGVCTDFGRAIPGPATPTECMLRAFEAFMLTAAEHDMPVICSLFTFDPESREETRFYRDPRCIEAHKEYAAAFARRCARFDNLIWELINEPPLRHPGQDDFEQRVCGERPLHGHLSHIALEEARRATPLEAECLPDAQGLEDLYVSENERPVRELDYALSVQDMFSQWVRQMAAVIRQNGNPKQLVTAGHFGSGAGLQPNPQVHWNDVDFTSAWTRWVVDELLLDGLATKTPERPNLIQATRVMSAQDHDSSPRCTEEDSRNVLERRLVTAFASGGAGAVVSLWNAYGGMPSGDEVPVGFHRADLACTLEMDIIRPLSDFLKQARRHMIDRRPEETCMVIPHSSLFSNRDTATLSSRVCARVMSYHLDIPMRAVGEYALENLGNPPLIVLPSPHRLSQDAWETILRSVEAGSTLLVTGTVNFDEHHQPVDRLARFGIESDTRQVAREEEAIIFGTEHRVSYVDNRIARVDRAVLGGKGGSVRTEKVGSGKLVYCALPIELADNIEPTIALYRFALKQAVVQPPFLTETPDPGVLIRPLFFKDAILYCFVSETDSDKDLSLTDNATGKTIIVTVPAYRALMLLIGRQDGKVLARYGITRLEDC
ncbi:MAG: hypothetical protein KBC96_07995 [Armatimonadetes bacterium]|nr:hypothetical protein [Armatimonadota bacterium]